MPGRILPLKSPPNRASAQRFDQRRGVCDTASPIHLLNVIDRFYNLSFRVRAEILTCWLIDCALGIKLNCNLHLVRKKLTLTDLATTYYWQRKSRIRD
jgi:hypothetical protein